MIGCNSRTEIKQQPKQPAQINTPREPDMDLRIDNHKNIAYIKLSGLLRQHDILTAFDVAVSDKNYTPGMGRLWDFRDADLSALNAGVISAMAQYSLQFPPGINDVKVAFVTSRDLEYGLGRMFEMMSKANTPIRVFRQMNEAERWMIE